MTRRIRSVNSPRRAVAYLRVSKEEQNLSPEAQRAAINVWAKQARVTVVAWFEDHGLSGALPIDKRPALLAAIDALTEHGAGVLVVAKRDRMARDTVEAAMLERLVQRIGARVVSTAGEGTDNDDPTSVLLRRMVDAFAEYERQIIKARTKAALAAKKARGERVGELAYGWKLAKDKVHVEPCEAELFTMKRVHELRAGGMTFRAIVEVLSQEGHVSRAAKPLSLKQIARIAERAA